MPAGTREIIVDNTDSGIKYTGSWFSDNAASTNNLGNFGKVFLSTQHGTRAVGSTASYSYRGIQGRVFGTTDITLNNGVSDPDWECFLDGKSIGRTNPFASAENNWVLCDTGTGISEGDHELQVRVTRNTRTFWMDGFHYMPASDVSLDHSIIKIWSIDPAIRYSSNWGAWGGGPMYTETFGATMTITFVGSSVTWVGMHPAEMQNGVTTSKYTIDGKTSSFTIPGGGTDFNWIFFSSGDLGYGTHTLVMTHEGGSQSKGITLDYLYVTNGRLAASFEGDVDTGSDNTGGKSDGGSTSGGGSSSSGGPPSGGGSSGTGTVVGGKGGTTTLTGTAARPGATNSNSKTSGSSSNGDNDSEEGELSVPLPNTDNDGDGDIDEDDMLPTYILTSKSTGTAAAGHNAPLSTVGGVAASHNKIGAGIIVGAVLGSLALVIFSILFFLIRRRKRRNALYLAPGDLSPIMSSGSYSDILQQTTPLGSVVPIGNGGGSGASSLSGMSPLAALRRSDVPSMNTVHGYTVTNAGPDFMADTAPGGLSMGSSGVGAGVGSGWVSAGGSSNGSAGDHSSGAVSKSRVGPSSTGVRAGEQPPMYSQT